MTSLRRLLLGSALVVVLGLPAATQAWARDQYSAATERTFDRLALAQAELGLRAAAAALESEGGGPTYLPKLLRDFDIKENVIDKLEDEFRAAGSVRTAWDGHRLLLKGDRVTVTISAADYLAGTFEANGQVFKWNDAQSISKTVADLKRFFARVSASAELPRRGIWSLLDVAPAAWAARNSDENFFVEVALARTVLSLHYTIKHKDEKVGDEFFALDEAVRDETQACQTGTGDYAKRQEPLSEAVEEADAAAAAHDLANPELHTHYKHHRIRGCDDVRDYAGGRVYVAPPTSDSDGRSIEERTTRPKLPERMCADLVALDSCLKHNVTVAQQEEIRDAGKTNAPATPTPTAPAAPAAPTGTPAPRDAH